MSYLSVWWRPYPFAVWSFGGWQWADDGFPINSDQKAVLRGNARCQTLRALESDGRYAAFPYCPSAQGVDEPYGALLPSAVAQPLSSPRWYRMTVPEAFGPRSASMYGGYFWTDSRSLAAIRALIAAATGREAVRFQAA